MFRCRCRCNTRRANRWIQIDIDLPVQRLLFSWSSSSSRSSLRFAGDAEGDSQCSRLFFSVPKYVFQMPNALVSDAHARTARRFPPTVLFTLAMRMQRHEFRRRHTASNLFEGNAKSGRRWQKMQHPPLVPTYSANSPALAFVNCCSGRCRATYLLNR